ncbi:hypothetical protein FIBSPDRAFT_866675 [Athelia psychrophila]|uniref:Uncharacterized protein n=1 Tax=Athelia psychrophila TaxID=1759441 RepID=A0A166ENA1_9AGAM|nr:hypothetical protein FIBSPDRAFT_866675 [Fibularhizoctonia sp. CBS 109695]
MNMNADEVAVLGVGLYGAALSKQFKTKDRCRTATCTTCRRRTPRPPRPRRRAAA